MVSSEDAGSQSILRGYLFASGLAYQIQPEYGDRQTDAGRDGWTRLARTNSQARTGTGEYSFSLFSSPRAGLAPGFRNKYH